MNKGFTLVEILVVIAILGIISAVIIINTDGSIEDAQVAVDKIDEAHDSAVEEKCKAFGKLYMVGSHGDSLYVLDTDVAGRTSAKKIGARFGPMESIPKSITSHKGKLYMVGQSSDSLWELDTEATGISPAKKIGMSFGGQGGEDTPTSITSHNGKLYMIGWSSDSLWELDTEATGNPPRKIGKSFGLMEGSPTSITSHNGKLYMVGSSRDSLWELDTEATGRSPAKKIGMSFGGYGR